MDNQTAARRTPDWTDEPALVKIQESRRDDREGAMAKFKITYKGAKATTTPSEEVEAEIVRDSGHEGEWIDFLIMNRLVLRVQAGEVDRVERVSG